MSRGRTDDLERRVESGGYGWVYPLLGVGLLVLLALQHLRAYLGDAVYEHLPQMVSQFTRQAAGQGTGEAALTGGGSLVLALHGAINQAGYSYVMAHWLHLIAEAVAIGTWLWWAPRRLPRPWVWATALWLVLYPVPKLHLYENSAFVGFAAIPLLAALLAAQRRAHLGWLAIAATAYAVCAYFSLIALFLLPALWLAVALTLPRRRLLAAGMLTFVAAAVVLPQLLTTSPGGDGYEHLLFRFRPDMLGGTALAALGSSAGYLLLDPPLVLGLGITLLVLRRTPLAPALLPAVPWLLAAALPVPWLDPFDAPYHYLAASPARALLAGAALVWLLEALPRAAGRPIRPEPALAAAVVVALGVVGTLAALDARVPPAERGMRQRQAHCTVWEDDCHHWRIHLLFEELLARELIEEGHPTTFHGVYAECLNGAWNWRLQTRGTAPPPWHFSNLLLLPQLDDGALVERLHGVPLADTTAVPHVEIVSRNLEWAEAENGSGRELRIGLDLLEGADMFVGLSSRLHFCPGEVVAGRAGAEAMPELTRCDHHHDEFSRRWYDGYLLLDGRVGNRTTIRIQIEDRIGDAWAPESVDILAIPAERPAER